MGSHIKYKVFQIVILFNLYLVTISMIDEFHRLDQAEKTGKYWESLAYSGIKEANTKLTRYSRAKNVIIFVGAGMGVSSITPARILKGQQELKPGEDGKLFFETFPDTCFIRTYSVDSQVPDTGSAATALLSGVKTNIGVVGVTARVQRGQSGCQMVQNNTVLSIFDHAQLQGKSTGIVTNGRITSGSAAAAYARVAEIGWESQIPDTNANNPGGKGCFDIGRQLVENNPGRKLKVILGGGGRHLYPQNYTDHITRRPGQRQDGVNLVKRWLELRNQSRIGQDHYRVAHIREDLLELIHKQDIKYLLGIFNDDRMNFDKEREKQLEPSLAEMTQAAVSILEKDEKGFVLLVENALIDAAHHQNMANMALHETLAFERAVQSASKMVSIEDTLIIVTAPYSQPLTMNGYPSRGHQIMGIAGNDVFTKAFTTLIYPTGPGHKENKTSLNIDTTAPGYQSYSGIYLNSSHHSGEDVAVYAMGPMSHLFHGTKEQSYVGHAMAFAACLGQFVDYDHCFKGREEPTFTAKLFEF